MPSLVDHIHQGDSRNGEYRHRDTQRSTTCTCTSTAILPRDCRMLGECDRLTRHISRSRLARRCSNLSFWLWSVDGIHQIDNRKGKSHRATNVPLTNHKTSDREGGCNVTVRNAGFGNLDYYTSLLRIYTVFSK